MLYFLFCLLFAVTAAANPIEPIIVTEQTLQINGEQRFFFAFEAGDEMLIDLSMLKGKSIKEFEILKYPESSKFQTLHLEELNGKKIRVFDRAVYEFRLKSGGAKRLRFKIQRVPYSSARINFDTHVKWKTVTDSIRRNYSEKINVIYDTTYLTKYRKVLQKTNLNVIDVANQEERVHSRTNLTNDNVNTLTFNLPPSKKELLFEKKVIGWAYWIGVGQEGTENYNRELKKFLQTAATKVVTKNLLAGLALGIYAVTLNPPKGENIHYELTVQHKQKNQQVAKGNITSTFGRELQFLEGKVIVKLDNDNFINGLNVKVKISAVVEEQYYRMEGYQVRQITPIELKNIKGRVVLRKREVPVINAW
ncbi:hypothetical protein [Aureispira anguillae]|uniref:Oxygen tolerance n=1 Tax=Aureispira anguillae TaxID=2864201 RepID=A0A915YBL6_9BACT|nr:hypothetical protein [Aureispira anguillae]BDS10083.1 hypothetical protein AsAng_0007890 [Aureispira anguillae]